MINANALLVIEYGEPHLKDTEFNLTAQELVLGRPWQDHQPDIPFSNLLISKYHARIISIGNNNFAIIDLSSKHGTMLNGSTLIPERQFTLKHGDEISLARGAVKLRFILYLDSITENTLELDYSEELQTTSENGLVIDINKRIIMIDGRPTGVSGKDVDLLLLLYKNKNKAVTYDEIRRQIWPERSLSSDGFPDVDTSEITALVYRLRKRLEPYQKSIVTLPRFGYRFDD